MSEFSQPSDSQRAFFIPEISHQPGLGGVFGPARVWFCQALNDHGICVLPEGGDMMKFMMDAETFGLGVEIWPLLPHQDEHSPEKRQRQRIQHLLESGQKFWIVTLPEGLEATWDQALEEVNWSVSSGPTREVFVHELTQQHFIGADRVEEPGQMSLRGGLIDVWWPGQSAPWRFDYFGDDLESIHTFDPVSQRRQKSLNSVTWMRHGTTSQSWTAGLSDWPWVWCDVPPQIENFPHGQHHHAITFGERRWPTNTTDVLSGQFNDRVKQVESLARQGTVHLFFETEAGAQQFCQQAPQFKEHASVHFHLGRLSQGIRFERDVFLNAHLLFGRTPVRGQTLSRDTESRLLTDLKKGDLVVHIHHGIARYQGMKMLKKKGIENEYMALEFADRTWLYVPATQMDLVQRYVGAGPKKPDLSKLGGKRWVNQKEKVAEAVEGLAEDLLNLQARRKESVGISFPELDDWQLKFAALFPHEETRDQIHVLQEIEQDMTAITPMDRLLCGDVGYGKTEMAMRAAFKAVSGGKQVAVMVPTTVLAEQHLRTFRTRLSDFPVTVAGLSRLTSSSEAKAVLEGLQAGTIDIVVGTHRLLGEKVKFLDLGLVVIDEEQRFGVRHKELLKRWRVGVDILTLTATPIPRTLHMALLGLRDISNLMTPPVDRQAVVTQVLASQEGVLQQALERERGRGGQAFVLHNRIRTLEARAEKIRELVPEATVCSAHGRMNPRELEDIMMRFVRQEIDVLVCTTIISSGVDIPNVNTIVVDEAQRFGLAELHQLRGRVGRSDRRGYALLFLPVHSKLNDKAKKRLQAMEEYADLGAGFQIAMRDLEIRGAGNILGAEQSGHIISVGYELYCQMLENAVKVKRGEAEQVVTEPVSVDIPMAAYLPEEWTGSRREKITALRRLLDEKDVAGIDTLQQEFIDRFGPLPQPFINLINVLRLKCLLRPLFVKAVVMTKEGLCLRCQRLEGISGKLDRFPGRTWIEDRDKVILKASDECPGERYVEILLDLLSLSS